MYTNQRQFCSVEELGIYASMADIHISYAVMGVVMGNDLSKGMNPLAFTAYSDMVGALVITPFASFLENVCAFEAFLLMGLKDTSLAFASTMPNLAPAIIFVMVWASCLEKVNIMCARCKAKIVGTLIRVCGAMAMSFLQGLSISRLWSLVTHSNSSYDPNPLHSVENILVSFYQERKGSSDK